MSVRYVLTSEAQAHIDAIGVYIARDSVDAALKVLDAIEEAFELLAAQPGIGHSREDLTNRPLKCARSFQASLRARVVAAHAPA